MVSMFSTKRFGLLATLVIMAGVLLWFGLPRLVVYNLERPKPSNIPECTELAGFPVEEVQLKTSDGVTVAGWYVEVPGEKAVVLAHGIDANRLQNRAKAELFASMGFAVLLYDARGHGESQRVRVTGGWEERHDLEATVAYLQEKGYTHIGVDGFSMGASTIAYAVAHGLKPDFVIMESCFKDVPTLIQNAVLEMRLPAFTANPVVDLISKRIGFSADDLSPIACMPKITMPVLLLLGDSEFQVKEDQAREMFEAIAAGDKTMHVFEKAGHEVFCVTKPDEYKELLAVFLARAEGPKPKVS